MPEQQKILILDFGSQYTQLITRRIRELGAYSEVFPYTLPLSEIRAMQPEGIILSGGPASVYDENSPQVAEDFFEQLPCPVLGICYGMQLMAKMLGGTVTPATSREYGRAILNKLHAATISPADTDGSETTASLRPLPLANAVNSNSSIIGKVHDGATVWMSHGDEVESAPQGFEVAALSDGIISVIEDPRRKRFGLQFHPEVSHTDEGRLILESFLREICGLRLDWQPESFIERQVAEIAGIIPPHQSVVCGLSGGVDSTVAAVLVQRAIGDRLRCIFVNTGLLRLDEFENTLELYQRELKLNVFGVDASEEFYMALRGITEPEQKRKVIGYKFVEIFEREAAKFNDAAYLAQGTLYPDVIESQSVRGPSAVIKSHHNVGGLPSDLRFKLIEPLRFMFKDEVRQVGKLLGISDEIIYKQPFPGPGLAVRIPGEVNAENVLLLQKADLILNRILIDEGLARDYWQSFAVLLPVKSVGVMGDERTYERAVALRIVQSTDGMTADWARVPYNVLEKISRAIIGQVRGINRVVYDITSKPPGTIEWE